MMLYEKCTRNFKLFVIFLLIFIILIGLYTNYLGNSKNHSFQSVLYKFMKPRFQHLKVPHESVSNKSRNTKKISDTNVVFSEKYSSTRKAIKTTITRIKPKYIRMKLGNREKVQTLNVTNEKDSKLVSDNCTRKEVTLSQTKLPITGLVSFPGSGNTWTRHLIQQMTGLGTSSVYCDSSLRVRGFPYECQQNKSRTVVVKTHESRHLKMFSKVVLLLRNPYDAFLSYANYLKAGHTGHPSKESLIKAVDGKFKFWLHWYYSLVHSTINTFKGPVHIIQYENLQSNMTSELKKLATFFDLNVADRDIECTVKLQEGNFHRLSEEKKHFQLLQALYSKGKLLKLREAARKSETIIKDAYDIDIDLGGSTEKLLLQGV